MLKKHALKLKPHWILIACLLGTSILQVPLRLLPGTLGTLPDWLFHLFGIFMGYFFYFSGKYVKSGIIVVSIICCSFLYFKGYDLWLHKINFGTFTGIVKPLTEKPEFQFTDRNGNTITRKDFEGKYVVLDFWTTSCGVCFQKFPKFEEYDVKYLSSREVDLYSINVKLPRDKEGEAFSIISDIGYSFSTLQLGQLEDAESIFGVNGYPTVIVLNPQCIMIFRGNMEKAFSFLESELKKNVISTNE